MSIKPHGGKLIDQRTTGESRERLISEAKGLPRIELLDWQVSDLDMIAVGAMSPLTGFMGEQDYRTVVKDMRLADGTPWSLPICLRVDRTTASAVVDRAALHAPDGKLLAVMNVQEKFEGDKRDEAKNVFRTDEEAHPGVAALYSMGDVMLGGEVQVVDRPNVSAFAAQRNDPAELRAKFQELGWNTIVGFQTRNPIYRAHE
jgi:sulfate adenylyltransferase